jgi:hypothetical protein
MRLILLGTSSDAEPPGLFTRGETELALLRADAKERYLFGEQLCPAQLMYFSAHRVLRPALAPQVYEMEVEPMITRLLQRGGNACVFLLGEEAEERSFGERGLLAQALQQLLKGLPAGMQLLASAVAVDESARVAVEQVNDLLRPVAAPGGGSATEVEVLSADSATTLLRTAARSRTAAGFLLIRLLARRTHRRASSGVGLTAATADADGRCSHPTTPRPPPPVLQLQLLLMPPIERLAKGPPALSFAALTGAIRAGRGARPQPARAPLAPASAAGVRGRRAVAAAQGSAANAVHGPQSAASACRQSKLTWELREALAPAVKMGSDAWPSAFGVEILTVCGVCLPPPFTPSHHAPSPNAHATSQVMPPSPHPNPFIAT